MLEGFHYQNAYVTRDIDRWIEAFGRHAKVDRMFTHEGTTPVITPQGRGAQTNKLAFFWVGDVQYELIQPVSGDVSIYREALPADDGLKLHHICMRIDDWDDFRARVDQQPLPVAMEGGDDLLKFLYLDARAFLGHYLEYTWMSEERWARMGGPPRAG